MFLHLLFYLTLAQAQEPVPEYIACQDVVSEQQLAKAMDGRVRVYTIVENDYAITAEIMELRLFALNKDLSDRERRRLSGYITTLTALHRDVQTAVAESRSKITESRQAADEFRRSGAEPDLKTHSIFRRRCNELIFESERALIESETILYEKTVMFATIYSRIEAELATRESPRATPRDP
ncbi:MAG: hypothetical protein ABH846_01415 [Patescibacteria group bacterium]